MKVLHCASTVSDSSFGRWLTTTRPIGATLGQALPPSPDGDQSLDVYYQKKMLYDRLSDSLARIVIAGLVFAYCRNKVNQLES